MKSKIFTIYDSKVKAYLPPFYLQSTGAAMRALEDTVNDNTTQIGKHPEDYILYEIGTFEDDNCSIELLQEPITLAKAIEVLTTKPPQPDLLDN